MKQHMDGPFHPPNMSPMDPKALEEEEVVEDNVAVDNLKRTRDNVAAIVASSDELRKGIAGVDSRFSLSLETLEAASDAINPLQTQSISAKALHSRINRAVAPALSVLHSFSLVESLQRSLVALSSKPTTNRTNLSSLLKYVNCVDRLNVAVVTVTEECEPAVLKLQEAVEFLSRTKATDQLRLHRLRETLAAIKALYETEVDALRYEGVLDEALLRLQDDYEGILLQIKHRGIGDRAEDELELEGLDDGSLGTDLEVEVLGRISETLASNDCLDICIDIYVKARYRRAAKALMRLNPTYLKTYAPEDIDRMEWEALESAITLWIEHFQLAVQVVFIAEKNLCGQVLSGIMGGTVWPECFVKIADKIMAVFFRFGEGVARSSKEPQKLFKLLDMYDAMDRMRNEFLLVFDGESGTDICTRFRELQKLLVDTTSKVFWEFGLQIEGQQDGAPPPADGSVPNIVRYAVNYLKCLAATGYGATMEHVLRTEQTWKSGYLSRPDPYESLLQEAVSNALDALQRNVETKRSRYKDSVASHILAVNSYWYMYMRTKGSELAKLVGEETMKKKYKMAAEEAAYSYQAQAWGPLVKLLEREEPSPRAANGRRDALENAARGKMEAFARELEENLRRHRGSYCVPDADLREQIKGAVIKMVMPAYTGFLQAHSGATLGRSLLPPESVKELLGRLFEGGEGMARGRARRAEVEGGTLSIRRREEEVEEERNIGDGEHRTKNIKRREYKNQVEEEREEGGEGEDDDEEEGGGSGDDGRGSSRKSSFRTTRRFNRQMDEEDNSSEETRDTLRGGHRGRRSEVIEAEKLSRRVFKSRADRELDRNVREGGDKQERRRPILDKKRTSFERRRTKYEGEEESVGRDYRAIRGEREWTTRTRTESRTSSFRDREVTRQIEDEKEEEESDGRSSERRRSIVAQRSRPNFGRRNFRNRAEDEGEEGTHEIGGGRVRKEGARREIVEGKKTSFGRRELKGLTHEGGDREESEGTIGEAKGKGRERRGMVEGEKVSLRREFRSREDNERKEIGEGNAYIRRREFRRQLDEEVEQNAGAAIVRRGDRRTRMVESGNSKPTRREF